MGNAFNTDVTGLNNIHSEIKKMLNSFNNSAEILSRVSVPTGNAGTYKQSIGQTIIACMKDSIQAGNEVKRFINDIEKVNRDVEVEIENLEHLMNGADLSSATEFNELKESKEKEGGGGFFDFLSEMISIATATELNRNASNQAMAGAVISIVDEKTGDKLLETSKETSKAAEEVIKENTGAKVLGTFYNCTFGAGREAFLRLKEGIADGAKKNGHDLLYYDLAGQQYLPWMDSGLIEEAKEEQKDAILKNAEEVAVDNAGKDMEKFYEREKNKYINDLAGVKYLDEKYMFAEGVFQGAFTEVVSKIPIVGLPLKFLTVDGNTTQNTLNRMKNEYIKEKIESR